MALPFGLRWGTARAEVEKAVQQAGGTLAAREGDERLVVEGLSQEGLLKAVFSFDRSGLSGLELQYQQTGWNFATYDEFMHRVKRSLEDRYGPGKQMARKQEQEEKVWQTVLRYGWPVGTNRVELVYFAAQDAQNDFRLISLHYLAQPPAFEAPKLTRAPQPQEDALFGDLPLPPPSVRGKGSKRQVMASIEPVLPER